MNKLGQDGIHISVDPGSTHMGKKHLITQLVEKAKKGGANTIKFQLFPNEPKYTDCGNVWLSPDLFDHAYRVGKQIDMGVTASIFGPKEAEILARYKIPYVKFAYSMSNDHNTINAWLNRGTIVVVTTDVMSAHKLPTHENLVKLFTYTVNGQTQYPCTSIIDFRGLFPERFNGFSDHTLGEAQAVMAKKCGANWFEKHAGLLYDDVECPDKYISMNINDLSIYTGAIRK